MAGETIWVVAAALIDAAGRVLVQQRPPGKSMAGLWEFPGGKIEPGERPADALVRELHEELAIIVAPADCVPATFVTAPLPAGELVMLLYTCRRWQRDPVAVEATELRWSDLQSLADLPMPPADVPLVEWLSAELATSRS